MGFTKIMMLASLLMAGGLAGASECDLKLGDDRFVIGISEVRDTYSTTVSMNSVSVPALGPCWHENRPSTRHVRCTHQNADIRIEVYPWAQTTSGKIIGPSAVFWRGDRPQAVRLDCR